MYRSSTREEVTVLKFISADANICVHKVRMRITTVRHIFHHSWRTRICCTDHFRCTFKKHQPIEFGTTRQPTEISKKI